MSKKLYFKKILSYFKLIKPHQFFLTASVSIGLLYFVTIPPLQSPDEFNHFYRAWQIADGQLISLKLDNRIGGYIPRDVEAFLSTFRFTSTNPDYNYNFSSLHRACDISLDERDKEFRDFPNTAYYSPVSYLPQAICIALLKNTRCSLGQIYYATRLMMLALWIIVIWHCCRRFPAYQWLIAVLTLLPTNLVIVNSFSADNVTNMLAFGLITVILKLAFTDTRITRGHIFFLVLLTCLLALAKMVYLGLILLFFIIPKSKLGNNRARFLNFFLIILPAIVLTLWWASVINRLYLPFDNYNSTFTFRSTVGHGSNYHKQLEFILSHPVHTLNMLFNSIFNRDQMYVTGYVVAYGAYLGYPCPNWVICCAYVLILCVLIGSGHKLQTNSTQKMALFFSFLVPIMLLIFSQYLFWEPVGSDYVKWLQGRYLIPLAPILFMLIGEFFSLKLFNEFALSAISVLLLNTYVLFSMYQLYYHKRHQFIYTYSSGFEKEKEIRLKDDSLKFENIGRLSRAEARNGVSSVMLSPDSQYGITANLGSFKQGDVIEIEIWLKGRHGAVAISGGGSGCKQVYAPANDFYFEDNKGWKKINYFFHFYESCPASQNQFHLSAFNLEGDTSYFDDLKIKCFRDLKP